MHSSCYTYICPKFLLNMHIEQLIKLLSASPFFGLSRLPSRYVELVNAQMILVIEWTNENYGQNNHQ